MAEPLRAEVRVTLRPGVLDPAGKAVLGGLHALGYDEVRSVRIGKLFEIELDPALSPEKARERLREMCERLLANGVIERFEIRLPGA